MYEPSLHNGPQKEKRITEMKIYVLEFNCNKPTTQQVNVPTNTDYMVGIKVTKNGEVLDIDPTEMTLGGTAADATKTNGYVTFTSASGDNAKYESKTIALEMEDGFQTTFTLNINVYKSQQGEIDLQAPEGTATQAWVESYVGAETSAFVTDTDMGTAISNATTDMATQTWVGSQSFATTSEMTSAISAATSNKVTGGAIGLAPVVSSAVAVYASVWASMSASADANTLYVVLSDPS